MKKRIIVLFAVLALSTSSSLFAFVGFENLGDVLYGGELDYGLDNGSLGGMRHTYFQHGVIVYYIFWE